MAKQRVDWKRLRQWAVAVGRRIAGLSVQGFHAARNEASKDKYRQYLSEAYGQMRERYPVVENTAREALDAIGVRSPSKAGSKRASAVGEKKKKTTTGPTTRKQATARKKTTRKTRSSKKKTTPRKKAA